MEDWKNTLLAEEKEIDAKWLQGFLKKFKKPDVQPSWIFRDKMKRKLNKKIQEKKEAQERVVLANIPSFAKWRFRLTGFATAICVFLFIFILSFFTDFFSYKVSIPSKYTKVAPFSLQKTGEVSQESTDGMFTKQTVLNPFFVEISGGEEDAGYLYDGKKYPKVAREMPVYKNAGALMNENVLKKALGSLKFGDIALKQFEELQMGDITLITPSNEYLNLHVANGSANFFKHSEPTEQKIIPPAEQLSEKEIEKLIEKKLKSLGISLANYGKAELLSSDAFTVAFAYPWMLNGYSIWDISDRPDFSPVVDWKIRPINMNIYYDRTTREIALYNVNIAKYTYANYPTLPKEEILKDFTVGIEKLNAPEIVYLMKTIDRESYYIPGLRFVVDERKAMYRALVEF